MSVNLASAGGGSVVLTPASTASNVTVTVPASTGDMVVDTGKSLSANGYQKLSSGLILQWFESSVQTGEIDITVSYPIAFPTAVLQVVVGTDADTSPADLICTLVSKTSTNCVIRFQSIGATGSTKAVVFAIGY